jgi:hypothetical protein
MSYCTACGQPRAGPAPFCTACGAPFAGPPSGAGPGPPGGPAQGGPEPGWHAEVPVSAGPGEPGGPPSADPGPGEPGGPPADDFFNSLFRPDPPPAELDQTRQIPALPGAGPDRMEPWPPPGRRQGGAGRRIVMAVGVLILLAAAGTGAWLVFRHQHASGSAGAGGGTHAQGSSGSPPTAKATRASSPKASAGSGLVAVAPGVSRQAPEPRVVAYLDDYFTAINRHSYRRFAVLLGAQMRQTLPGPAFYAGYRTTTDSAARLTGLSPEGGGRVEADVAFTSHQAPGTSPSHSGCTRWRIALVLAPRHGRLVLEPPPSGYHASYQAC